MVEATFSTGSKGRENIVWERPHTPVDSSSSSKAVSVSCVTAHDRDSVQTGTRTNGGGKYAIGPAATAGAGIRRSYGRATPNVMYAG